MSSGFGLKGTVGRCYPFFADYKECLQQRENDSVSVCLPEKVDYFECLHHKKEFSRVRQINEQHEKNEQAAKSDGGGGH
jgi:NADH dehydrogenase (ubiquinone) Fe-S protein 5